MEVVYEIAKLTLTREYGNTLILHSKNNTFSDALFLFKSIYFFDLKNKSDEFIC